MYMYVYIQDITFVSMTDDVYDTNAYIIMDTNVIFCLLL